MKSRKKDKVKTTEWLQCSLCGKRILPGDAEIHAKSCDAPHAFIQGKRFTGKVTKAESLLNTEKSPVTASVRDKDVAVWLSVSVMTMCRMAIGQPVVLNESVVKKAWPLSSGLVTTVGLSGQSMQDLGVEEGTHLTVHKLISQDRAVESAILELEESNDLFESEEFLAYVTSFLDGTFLTKGSKLRIKYFGQVCHCLVADMRFMSAPLHTLDSKTDNSQSRDSFSNKLIQPLSPEAVMKNRLECSVTSATSTPVKSSILSPRELDKTSDSTQGFDLSSSFSNLEINTSLLSPDPSTPRTQAKKDFSNLHTPTSSTSNNADADSSQSVADCPECSFGKFLSGVSKIVIKGRESGDEIAKTEASGFTLQDVGGLADTVEELKHRIHRAQQAGCLSRCVLVHGPAGTGKTLVVKAVTNSLGLHAVWVTGTDIWSKFFGQAEAKLRNIFQSAAERAPSIVVIDDLDTICPKRSQQTSGQQEHRVVGTLLSLVDGAGRKTHNDSRVVVLGITNNRDGLDPALRRSGRFGCEVEISVPNPSQRAQILRVMLSRLPHSLREQDVEAVARNAHGYVGADLTAIVNEASIRAVSRRIDNSTSDLSKTATTSPVVLTVDDFVYAGQLVKPSALREIQLEVPEVRWSDIGGMSEIKMRLKEAVELPLTHPRLYEDLGIEAPRGLLMYGPPGCSKTMIARAVATECSLNFLAVKGPELFNQYVGESEKAIREVFRKARAAAPSVVFFDEIDAIAAKRGSSGGGGGVDDRVLTQLLTEMDGLENLKDVFIMAATNRPDKIDRALLRPGRFDSLVYVPLPNAETRREILDTKLGKMKTSPDVCVESLVKTTADYSGAEVIQLCQEAALTALREDMQASVVHQRHFDTAAHKILPQTDTELLHIYHKFSTSQ